jgi:hypothetical protein
MIGRLTLAVLLFTPVLYPCHGQTPSPEELWLKITSTGAKRRLSLVIAAFTGAGAPAELDSLDQVFAADLRFSLSASLSPRSPAPGHPQSLTRSIRYSRPTCASRSTSHSRPPKPGRRSTSRPTRRKPTSKAGPRPAPRYSSAETTPRRAQPPPLNCGCSTWLPNARSQPRPTAGGRTGAGWRTRWQTTSSSC